MSAGDDLLGALHSFVKEGCSFTIAPAAEWNGVKMVQASISGPTGSRTAFGATPAAALEELVVRVVSARLAGEIKPKSAETIASLKRLGVFDDLPHDSYF